MTRLAAVLCLMTVPGLATAQSCPAPDFASAFAAAQASDATYRIVRGRFLFDADFMPEVSEGDRRVSASFRGQVLSADGFVTPVERPVSLDVSCDADQCGSLERGGEVVAFIRETPTLLVLDLGVCPMWVMPASNEVLDQVQRCALDGAC